MSVIKFFSILISVFYLAVFSGCKTTSVISSSVDQNIIGSWKGCDGRIITFTKEENPEADKPGDLIIGRYEELGKLGRYKFNQNEIGYKLTEKSPGHYVGTVKWQDLNGEETWKQVSIKIENYTYQDDSSDSCSNEMERVKQ